MQACPNLLWALSLPHLTECFYDLVISPSDTQVITGNAMVVAAWYKTWFNNFTTAYHLTLVSDYAWFSANSHTLTLLSSTRRTTPGAAVSSRCYRSQRTQEEKTTSEADGRDKAPIAIFPHP